MKEAIHNNSWDCGKILETFIEMEDPFYIFRIFMLYSTKSLFMKIPKSQFNSLWLKIIEI